MILVRTYSDGIHAELVADFLSSHQLECVLTNTKQPYLSYQLKVHQDHIQEAESLIAYFEQSLRASS